jgi:hypothetical protein
MKRMFFLVSSVLLVTLQSGWAEVPDAFSWINLESDQKTMTAVRRAIHDPSITAIREVGVEAGFALVLVASRENSAPTPDYDRWSIYNVELNSGASQLLVSGYGVRLIDWAGAGRDELAVTYYDCWECEAETLFTMIRMQKGVGWKARWINKSQGTRYPQPGILASMQDIDDDVKLVFAVVAQPKGGFAVGKWLYSSTAKAGNLDIDVERYSVDPVTNEDRIEKLNGRAALNWEREICTESNISMKPSTGQDSEACRSILHAQTLHQPASK